MPFGRLFGGRADTRRGDCFYVVVVFTERARDVQAGRHGPGWLKMTTEEIFVYTHHHQVGLVSEGRRTCCVDYRSEAACAYAWEVRAFEGASDDLYEE